MFRGKVTVRRGNPWLMRVVCGGLVALPLLFVGLRALPEESRRTLASPFILVFVAAYAAVLSRVLRPRLEVAEAHADRSGLFVDGRLLAARADIVQAYLRPAFSAANVKGVPVPGWPMTVEVVTTTGQLNLDGGDEALTRELLAALGFPPTVVPANHVADTPQNRRKRRSGWIIAAVAVLAVAALIATQALLEQSH